MSSIFCPSHSRLINSKTMTCCKFSFYAEKICMLFVFWFFYTFFEKKFSFRSDHQRRCQTIWTQIRPDITSGLILVETVCQGAVNPEIFARILFSLIGLKDIFAKLKFMTMALGVRIKGLFWPPPPEPITESCFSPISSYWFIRRIAQM